MLTRSGLLTACLFGIACSPPAPEKQAANPVNVAPEGALNFETLAADKIMGTFEFRGQTVEFLADHGDVPQLTLKLRGMALLLTTDPVTKAFDLDGFNIETGGDTAITTADKEVLHALEASLADIYQAHAAEWPALTLLNHGLGMWGDWSPTFPLKFFTHVGERFWESLCSYANKRGQGNYVKWVWASHDCGEVLSWFGECAATTAGCMYLEDPSTTDYVAMSMHPGGSCGDGTFFGNGSGSMSCHEPDHPDDQEVGYGNCFGRCGAGCGSDTQFTGDCVDHDQCVRFGHDTAAIGCDDQFSDTIDDWGFAPSCGGALYIPYNWVGTSWYQNCPSYWRNTNDGCDFGCQFIDEDCFR